MAKSNAHPPNASGASPSNSLLDAALQYAARGWRVFPLIERDKKPWKGSRGCKDATTNEQQIRQWWTERPDANIGIATGRDSGVVVVDYDSPAALKALQDMLGDPLTLHVKTGKGGHFYFEPPSGVSLPNSASKLAKGLDVRGDGGYVVAPPSRHPNGQTYAWQNGHAPILPFPDELLRRLRPSADSVEPTSAEPAPAESWLAVLRREGIPKGQRNETMAKVVGHYSRLAATASLAIDDVRAIVRDFNATACKPPLPDTELEPMIRTFYERDQAKLGPTASAKQFHLLDARELDALPDPAFLIHDYLVEDSIGTIYGDSGDGKSFLMLDMALAIAASLPVWCGKAVQQHGAVVYIAAEGGRGIKKRIRAWELKNHDGQRVMNFYVLPEAVQFIEQRDVRALIDAIEGRIGTERRVRFLVIDTLSWCMSGKNENQQEDMSAFVAGANRLRQEFGATVFIVHHTNKQGDLRGSAVLLNNVDTVLKTAREKDDRIRKLTVEKQKDFSDDIPPFYYTLRYVPEAESCIILAEDAPAKGQEPLPKKQQECLDALTRLGRATSGEWLKACGDLSRSTFYRWRDQFVRDRRVIEEGDSYRVAAEMPQHQRRDANDRPAF